MEFMSHFTLKNYLQILTHSLATFKRILSEALTLVKKMFSSFSFLINEVKRQKKA
jgi:hypothetical protein